MNCRGVSRRLSAYIDNELSPGIKGSVDEHLTSCAICRRKLGELTAISNAARTLPPLKVSDGFTQRVLESSRADKKQAIVLAGFKMRAGISILAFAAAAVAVFFLVGPKPPSINSETLAPNVATEVENPAVGSMDTVDFYQNDRVKIESFPIPEDARAIDFAVNDSSLLKDSLKIDDYVLPVIEKTKENVNVKF